RPYPTIPWRRQIFQGADDVPLWGWWACPAEAQGTIIFNYGITGSLETAWYSHLLAHKAYAQGWAVCLYDWRSHGHSVALSPVPSSDGWREGEDQVKIAQTLVQLGCPPFVALVGFSLGGQLALWGLKTASEQACPYIQTAATICPSLDSNRSLAFLGSTPAGRWIEQRLTRELRDYAQQRLQYFPHSTTPEAIQRIQCIADFDREMVIDYYGFPSVEDYYQQTSPLYFLETLERPYLILYAADDPLFEPALVAELPQKMANNPAAHLLLTRYGGHVSHIASQTTTEDRFWGFNRLLEFCQQQHRIATLNTTQQPLVHRE
ncbi:MAG: alpha/beta fold hydrolase, partial [Kamptonema sp. SIO4C4]|nr:alpha/beta fold hydrolase [Kamptonema sp. SIO4C4]